MKGLLYKDFLMAWKYCRLYLLITIVFFALYLFVKDYWFFAMYPGILFAMVPVNLLAYDEYSQWKIYGQTLPISKTQLVSAKYLVGLVPIVGLTVLVSIAYSVKAVFQQSFSWGELGLLAFLVFFVPILFSAISTPAVFKYGVEKGRILSLAVIGGVCAISVIYNVFLRDFFTVSMPGLTPTVLGIVGSLILAIYVLSWKLSILFFEKNVFYQNKSLFSKK